MKSWIILAVVLGILPFVAVAQTATDPPAEPRVGLMWQHTGLPAVFPLQVKTRSGVSYYLLLKDADTDAPALAAFIKGGVFFKVLVPPGRFRVTVFSGVKWQNEIALFGKGALTTVLELPDPLIFEARGLATKAGHLIDLTQIVDGELAQLTLKPQYICQTYGIDQRLMDAAVSEQFDDLGPLAIRVPGYRDRDQLYPIFPDDRRFYPRHHRYRRGLYRDRGWERFRPYDDVPYRPRFRVRTRVVC